jgi:hypothetical protein
MGNGISIADIKREQIDEFYWLKFLIIVSFVSIFRFVFSYQIFLFRSFLKWSFSNDLSQTIYSNNFRK